jgi:hypothetical protein
MKAPYQNWSAQRAPSAQAVPKANKVLGDAVISFQLFGKQPTQDDLRIILSWLSSQTSKLFKPRV